MIRVAALFLKIASITQFSPGRGRILRVKYDFKEMRYRMVSIFHEKSERSLRVYFYSSWQPNLGTWCYRNDDALAVHDF